MNFPFLTNSLNHPLKTAKKFFVDAPPKVTNSKKSSVFFLFFLFSEKYRSYLYPHPCGFFLECYTDITLVSTTRLVSLLIPHAHVANNYIQTA